MDPKKHLALDMSLIPEFWSFEQSIKKIWVIEIVNLKLDLKHFQKMFLSLVGSCILVIFVKVNRK